MNNNYFKLYSNCIPVKGAARSLICDLQRNYFHFIPNDLFEILKNKSTMSIIDIELNYGLENKETIKEYFDFLIKEEYIFFCDFEELKLFPDLELYWDHPSIIINAIIDVGIEVDQNFELIFRQLEELGCRDIQIRFFKIVSLNELSSILNLLEYSSIKSVELFLVYNHDIQDEEITNFVNSYLRIAFVVFHSAPLQRKIASTLQISAPIGFSKEVINDATHCGVISKKYFAINIDTFSEAQEYNTCLNRKISIDERGNIKNCPSMSDSYGNILSTTLKSVLDNNPEFKHYWSIHKDQVEVCKDCEFRYICTDCRAYTTDINNNYSKPFKCKYNPYTAEWES